jgi:hypothetical protein
LAHGCRSVMESTPIRSLTVQGRVIHKGSKPSFIWKKS